MIEKNPTQRPSKIYYERPYVPNPNEVDDYKTIPLLPVEAHTIISDSVGKKRLSPLDRLTLEKISESDDDQEIDFLALRKKIKEESIDYDEDC